ncbi:hypothetical protein ACJJTC_006616 [Scirpophaga incertulas]
MSDIPESPPAMADASNQQVQAVSSSSTDSLSSAATPSSKASEAQRPSTLMKPSGLKPPSKIGRLCSNSAPKPAVPISPRSDCGSSDTLRRLSDDSSRKPLSACSTYSISSMDALWEKHPRRLSEAGLRRSSDHSVVLTEDTDSFIIGERVWVGGTKPGQIAYIGETQFAPGEWAGIVLDDAIGKNDGSVAGVRYFQCAEKRGVFSRLTRLTRTPLITHAPHDASPVSDAGSVFDRPPSGAGRSRRALSPNGSVRSFISSKMNASISTTTNGELRLGDRVIVSSSRGSKAGALRFVGTTDFAPGVWAGVELDDPLGKNDGSVDGKRYFECSPRFGLFAPIAKVSRSPSNRKPGACAIHNNGRSTPLRRSNSRDSLTSLGTSIASSRAGVRLGVTSHGAQRVGGPRASSTPVSAKNALQELLREKQHHLERLMRERELERSEVAKVSLQAERAETALEQLKRETNETINENEKLKAELSKLNKQLEDEKQKVEDLMFRNEEENINKEDYNRYKEAMEKEKALHMHPLSAELQKLLDEAYALLKEKEQEKDSLGKSMSEELSKLKADSEKALNDAKTKMAIAQTEFDTQLSVVTAKLQVAESKLETEKQNLERLNKENGETILDLNTKLTQLQAAIDDKTLELSKVMGVSKEHEVNLTKEITKLKMELSAKVLDLEQSEDAKRKQEVLFKSLEEEMTRMKEEYSTKVTEYETLLNEVSQHNDKYKLDIMELQNNLSAKTKDYERLLSESSSSTTSSEKLINEYKQSIHERDKEIIKLKDSYEQATANFNIKHSKIAEEHKREIEDRNSKIEELMKEIENHKQALDQSKVQFDHINTQLTINIDELKALKEENDKLKHTIAELTENNNILKAKISEMELEIGEHKRQLDGTIEKCNELQKMKDKIETEYMNLTGQTTDSNEQFNRLTQHLKETEMELQDLKDKQRDVANTHGRIEQELKQKIFKLQDDFSLERAQSVQTMDEKSEKLNEAEKKIKEFENQASDIQTRIRELDTANENILAENINLKQEIESLKVKELELNKEFDTIRKKLEVDLEKYKDEVNILKAEGASSEVKLIEKVDQLTEAQNDLNNKLEEARKHEDSLQKILDDMTTQLNNQKTQFEKEIMQTQSQLVTATEELDKHKLEEARLNLSLEEKQNTIKDLSLKLEMLTVDVKSNSEMINEKDRQLAQVSEEINRLTESKKDLEDKLNNIILENSSLKQKYDNLSTNSSVEGNLLKEQLEHVEILRKEVTALMQDKSVLENKCLESVNELAKLKEEHDQALKSLKDSNNVKEELQKTLHEKELIVRSHIEQIENYKNKTNTLETQIEQLRHDIANKETILEEKELSLQNINASLQSGSQESQEIIIQLRNENAHLNDRLKAEVEFLTNQTNNLKIELTDKEKQLEDLHKMKEKIVDLEQRLQKSNEDIKQLSNINEGQKTNYEDLNKQLRSQYEELKNESKRVKHDLKATLKEYESELEITKGKVKAEIDKQTELRDKLTEADRKVLDLSQRMELMEVQQTSEINKDSKLEKLTLELQAARMTSAEALEKSEKVIKTLKSDVEHKIRDLKQRDEMITKLQEDIKNLKVKLEIAEREKAIIQKETTAKANEIRDKNDNEAVGILGQGDAPVSQIKDDKEMVDGQVTFLNSVIVDMQRKNEQLMARVQALEGSGLINDTPVFNGRKPRAVAPRLFCDICDVFDAHDTEECPRQAAEPDAPAPAPPAGRRAPPPPRPYCDICEVFGHATENCDEEETF